MWAIISVQRYWLYSHQVRPVIHSQIDRTSWALVVLSGLGWRVGTSRQLLARPGQESFDERLVFAVHRGKGRARVALTASSRTQLALFKSLLQFGHPFFVVEASTGKLFTLST